MENSENKEMVLSPEEKFSAILNLKRKLEDDFIALGSLLSDIRRTKAFQLKGFKTFKDFVEKEFSMDSAFATKLIDVYDIFIDELDEDESDVKKIGCDKLNIIKPMVRKTPYEEAERWIDKAKELDTSELKAEVREAREKSKKKTKSLKDVFIQQYLEKMLAFFNCNRKDMDYKLGLYFQDEDLEPVKEAIRVKQRRFEESMPENDKITEA